MAHSGVLTTNGNTLGAADGAALSPSVSAQILVLEDRPERQAEFRRRFPDAVIVATYSAAVTALDGSARFECAYLDHDFELTHNGADVAFFMAYQMPAEQRPSRVVVHSSNRAGSLAIYMTLKKAGFQVEQNPYPPW